MNIKNFQSGTYQQEYQYKSFLLSEINHTFTWDDPKINTMLEDATRALGELNAHTKIVPDIDIFIHMHIAKEATTSSKIEGTKTEMDEVFIEDIKEQADPERRDDRQEVKNYISAMNDAIRELQTLPLSTRLIKQTHKILLDSSRGEAKQPGEFRKSQNWIGGTSINNASFVPPSHHKIDELMSDLEKFLHNDEISVPHLIKIAIAHYQFETIHPFLDGNGRIGRLLITLYLVSKGLLQLPSLYVSEFIETYKDEYYKALTLVRTQNDLAHWIKFFLKAIITTSNNSVAVFSEVLQLKKDMDDLIVTFKRRAPNAKGLLDFLYQKPVASINEIAAHLEVSTPTALSLVKEFEEERILKEITGLQRNKRYVFVKYFKIYTKSRRHS